MNHLTKTLEDASSEAEIRAGKKYFTCTRSVNLDICICKLYADKLMRPTPEQQFSSPQTRGQKGVLSGLLDNLSPVIVSLLFGTLVAVTPPLKGLFTVLKDHGVQRPSAPDGKPLLSVILDSTEYLGAAAIPLGLLVTGASFANMSIPRRSWFRLPLRAIFGLTLIKLVCLPALGIVAVSFIDRYTHFFAGEEGRVLKLICLYYSCTVTSTNQISLSSIAAGIFLKPGESSDEEVASNVDLLCSFVALQASLKFL
jgi:hypothetical protein